MVTCPYCQRRAMSTWDKLSRAGRRTKSCAACGKRLLIPRGPLYAAMLPILVAGIVGHSVAAPLEARFVLLAVGFIGSLLILAFVVPVVKRDA